MVAVVFAADLGLVVVGLATLAVVVWAIVDVARQPPQLMTAGRKAAWIVGCAVGWYLFVLPGVIVAAVYLWGVRPKLRRVA